MDTRDTQLQDGAGPALAGLRNTRLRPVLPTLTTAEAMSSSTLVRSPAVEEPPQQQVLSSQTSAQNNARRCPH